MDAFDAYYCAIAAGQIPACVPVESVDGTTGVATSGVPINEKAEPMVFAQDSKTRATVAIMACDYAMTRGVPQIRSLSTRV